MVTAVGADKISIYKQIHLHPKVPLTSHIHFIKRLTKQQNMMSPAQVAKLLDVYSSSGRIDLKPISLPGPHPNLPGLQQLFNEKRKELKRLDELIPYNDCLYTNMYRYLLTLKPLAGAHNEEFWITKLVSDELLHGTYSHPLQIQVDWVA